ncbi:unknown [Bacteroides sp. CAG:875]|nr:unknown [Bacteroides sp. CAG:875]
MIFDYVCGNKLKKRDEKATFYSMFSLRSYAGECREY